MSAPELNIPEEFVVTTIVCDLAVLVIVILAPLISASEGSLTLPTILPVATVVCANRGEMVPARIAKKKPKATATILAGVNMLAESGADSLREQVAYARPLRLS